MTDPSWTGEGCVAFFTVFRKEHEPSGFESMIAEWLIQVDDNFYIGRSPALCRYSIGEDRAISNRHLHVHCILYDETSTTEIPPLVYVQDCSSNGTFIAKHNPEADELSNDVAKEQRVHRNSGAVLLDDGDQLRISPSITLRFRYSDHYRFSPGNGLSHKQKREIRLFNDRYVITDRVVGRGGSGAVYVAIHKESKRQLACKVIEYETRRMPLGDMTSASQNNADFVSSISKALGSGERAALSNTSSIVGSYRFREFDILKDLDHPNIIHLQKVFWSDNTFYIFQDLIPGGDLFSYVRHKGGHLNEAQATAVLLQILKAVEYLHDHGIVHRDLKLENILMTSLDDRARVVVADFESARRVPSNASSQPETTYPSRRMNTQVGTAEYTAPEVRRVNPTISPSQGYSKAVDMWSIGVIAAILLTGESIFAQYLDHNREDFDARVMRAAAECDLGVIDWGQGWRSIGSMPKDLIKKLLVLDETRRLTASEAVKHIWFTHKRYRVEINALYQLCTKDWHPRRKIFRLVEKLNLEKLHLSKSVRTPKESIPASTISPYFASPESSPRRILPMKIRRSTIRARTPLPCIDEETAEDIWHANIPSLPQVPSKDRPQELEDGRGLDVENEFSQLRLEPHTNANVEVAMTDVDGETGSYRELSLDGDTMEDRLEYQAVSESPIARKPKRRFLEDTDDESPIAPGRRKRTRHV